VGPTRTFRLRLNPGLRLSDSAGVKWLLSKSAPGTEDVKQRAALRAPDELSKMDRVGVVHHTAERTLNVDHGRGTPCEPRQNILFWDIEERLAIIQPP
jgi:hypothetical protein